jgi:hypothetical protein
MSKKNTPELLTIGLATALALWGISFLIGGARPSAVPPITADKPSIEQQEEYVSIWKIVVDTQMHSCLRTFLSLLDMVQNVNMKSGRDGDGAEQGAVSEGSQ